MYNTDPSFFSSFVGAAFSALCSGVAISASSSSTSTSSSSSTSSESKPRPTTINPNSNDALVPGGGVEVPAPEDLSRAWNAALRRELLLPYHILDKKVAPNIPLTPSPFKANPAREFLPMEYQHSNETSPLAITRVPEDQTLPFIGRPNAAAAAHSRLLLLRRSHQTLLQQVCHALEQTWPRALQDLYTKERQACAASLQDSASPGRTPPAPLSPDISTNNSNSTNASTSTSTNDTTSNGVGAGRAKGEDRSADSLICGPACLDLNRLSGVNLVGEHGIGKTAFLNAFWIAVGNRGGRNVVTHRGGESVTVFRADTGAVRHYVVDSNGTLPRPPELDDPSTVYLFDPATLPVSASESRPMEYIPFEGCEFAKIKPKDFRTLDDAHDKELFTNKEDPKEYLNYFFDRYGRRKPKVSHFNPDGTPRTKEEIYEESLRNESLPPPLPAPVRKIVAAPVDIEQPVQAPNVAAFTVAATAPATAVCKNLASRNDWVNLHAYGWSAQEVKELGQLFKIESRSIDTSRAMVGPVIRACIQTPPRHCIDRAININTLVRELEYPVLKRILVSDSGPTYVHVPSSVPRNLFTFVRPNDSPDESHFRARNSLIAEASHCAYEHLLPYAEADGATLLGASRQSDRLDIVPGDRTTTTVRYAKMAADTTWSWIKEFVLGYQEKGG